MKTNRKKDEDKWEMDEKKKPTSNTRDWQSLCFDGWKVGLEPTTFRTTI